MRFEEEDALSFEPSGDQIPFRTVVAGTPEFAETEKAEVLQEACQSPEVREWFEGYLDGLLPTPWDVDPLAELDSWWDA